MEHASLPRTDLKVSRIAFGCEPLGGCDWGSFDIKQATAAVLKAVDLGINLFDTANVYGLGRSESVLAKTLGTRRHDVIIITKGGVNWYPRHDGERAKTFLDSSPSRISESVEGSLRRLQLDCIPIYLVHWPDPNVPISDTMGALGKCRQQGKLRYIGVSNFSAELIEEADRIEKLACVELQYSLVDRRPEKEILPCCEKLGIGVLAYGPLAQGLLTGKYDSESRFGQNDRRHRLPHFHPENLATVHGRLDRLRTLGVAHQKTVSQVAIRWVLDKPVVSSAIAGAKSATQIEDDLGAIGWRLTPSERLELSGGF